MIFFEYTKLIEFNNFFRIDKNQDLKKKIKRKNNLLILFIFIYKISCKQTLLCLNTVFYI